MKPVDSQLKEIIKGAIKEVQMGAPSEIKLPKALSESIASLLNQRLGDEYTAHFFYRNAANWCKGVGYNKAAAYFENEASSELEHALKLQNYLVDWNIQPTIPSIKTTATFATLIDVISQAYDMEYALFEAYNKVSSAVLQADLATFDFLQDLREIQTKSVAEYSDFLNAARLINVNNPLDLLYFEQTYFN